MRFKQVSVLVDDQDKPNAVMLLSLIAILVSTIASQVRAQDSLRLDSLIGAEFARRATGGAVLVARNGKPVFRRAFGTADLELGVPMQPHSVFKIGSITKQITAVGILQLVAQGKVALDEDVRRYVPEFPTHNRRITVEQVLTHTSGLPNLVDLADFDALARQDFTVDSLLALTRDVPLHFDPGTSFRYSDTGYILLGAIIERVSGLRYGEYVESAVFKPLGMRASYYADDRRIIPHRAKGYTIDEGRVVNAPFISMTVPHGAGGLASTVDDLLIWHLALRAGSVLPGPLMSRAWQGRTLPNGVRSGYGFGFKMCSLAGRRTIGHGGFINGFSATALQLPDDTLDVIVLVNNDSDAPDAGGVARRIARFVLSGSALPKYVTLTAQERAALVGRYEIAPAQVREIKEVSGALVSQRDGGSANRLEALSAMELTLADSEGAFLFTFEKGADGRAASMRTSLSCEPVDVAKRLTRPN